MTETKKVQVLPSVPTYDDVRAVSPALEQYTKGPLLDGLWKRPELSPHDRSVVTVAALIARIQTIEMSFHFALALDNGVKPGELSEIITHLAFYSGWANAMSAVAVAAQITYHLGRAMDNGLTQPQASEVLTHIAFYAGWPCAFSALPLVKDVFEKRRKQ